MNSPLAGLAVEYISDAMRQARNAADGGLVDHFLPHAKKLALQLNELGTSSEDGDAYFSHADALLSLLLTFGSASADWSRALRPMLLEMLLLQQQRTQDDRAQLVRRLLAYVIASIPAQLPAIGKSDDAGLAACALPALPAEVIEVLLLRSSGCHAELLPCMQQMLRASQASPTEMMRCLRLLFAWKELLQPQQPGLVDLRRFLHELLRQRQEQLGHSDHASPAFSAAPTDDAELPDTPDASGSRGDEMLHAMQHVLGAMA
jgi:hypothetical protein